MGGSRVSSLGGRGGQGQRLGGSGVRPIMSLTFLR
jgi:hypothetical protein